MINMEATHAPAMLVMPLILGKVWFQGRYYKLKARENLVRRTAERKTRMAC